MKSLFLGPKRNLRFGTRFEAIVLSGSTSARQKFRVSQYSLRLELLLNRILLTTLTWLVLAVLPLCGQAQTEALPEPAPDQLVRTACNEILALAGRDERAAGGDIGELLKVVESKIAPHFDFATMTRLAVGKYWHIATEAQRRSLISEFRYLLIRTYTRAYTANREVRATVLPMRMAYGAKEVTVRSLLTLPGSRPPVMVDYDMWHSPTGWQIYNVSVDSMSLVTTYRTDFAERVRQSGIDGLILALTERNRALAAYVK